MGWALVRRAPVLLLWGLQQFFSTGGAGGWNNHTAPTVRAAAKTMMLRLRFMIFLEFWGY